MSLYNMMNGFNPACLFLLPLLGHPADYYPRFRDCFLSDDEKNIVVYTRVGGNNRNQGYDEDKLESQENFIRTWDDEYDRTYGYYEFSVPKEWESDFNKIKLGEFQNVSNEYVELIKSYYPEVAKSGMFDTIFGNR